MSSSLHPRFLILIAHITACMKKSGSLLFAYYVPTFFKRKSCSSFASYEIVQPCTTLSNFNIKITYQNRGKDKQP